LPERDAATTAAPASPATAAPPAISGSFAFWAAVATPCAAFWAPVLTVSFAAFAVLRPFDADVERERVVDAEPERLVPLRLLRRAVEPFREVLLLRDEALLLRVPADFEDPPRLLLVLVCAIDLSSL
jgi:hypothetical protein